MNNTLGYHDYHLALLQSLYDTIRAQSALLEQLPEESNELFMERFNELLNQLQQSNHDDMYLGQDILCQIIARYPQIAHLIPRDLLWYFGGDCLHFMPDEEIAQYQLLDERDREMQMDRQQVVDRYHQQQLGTLVLQILLKVPLLQSLILLLVEGCQCHQEVQLDQRRRDLVQK